jgi:hypothetical protein
MRIVRLSVWVLLIVAATFVVHELAHGLMGATLGYDVFVKLNGSGLVGGGDYRSALDRDLVAAAGPVVTLLQGVFGVWLVHRRPNLVSFSVVLSALLMRALAAAFTLKMPNDEGRLGLSWGVGLWTVHALVVAALLVMTIWAARRVRPSVWSWVGLVVLINIGVTAVVFGDFVVPRIYL